MRDRLFVPLLLAAQRAREKNVVLEMHVLTNLPVEVCQPDANLDCRG
jgi:hypothetical protein